MEGFLQNKLQKNAIIISLCIVFVVTNSVFIAFENYYFALLPVVLLVVGLYFYSLETIFWLIVLATPLSLIVKIKEFGLSINLPTEPLLIGILLLMFFRFLYTKSYNIEFIKHPVSIAIIINLVWIFITSLTSTLPVVSFKFLLSRLWFVVPFYFFAYYILNKENNFKKFNLLYILGFLIVIGYTFYNHKLYGFTQETSNWVMSPFYNDHTSYGAMLVFFIPSIIALFYNEKKSLLFKWLWFIVLIVFLAALVLSYTRAAWISAVAALMIFFVFYFRIKTSVIVLLSMLVVLFGFLFRDSIFYKIEKNRQDSSTNISQHVKSISNVSSDASNLERINRWQSAYRMFRAKPMLGFGPGTYAFKYAPYQFSYEKTIISTNAGNKGNAHSEYFGPLSESGLLGMFSFLAIVITVIITSVKVIKSEKDYFIKSMVMAAFLALCSYFLHGLLNNFLDTDKASIPFWSFIAFIVAMDIRQRQNTLKQIDL